MTSIAKARAQRVEKDLLHAIERHGLVVHECRHCEGRGCERCNAGISGFSFVDGVSCGPRCPLERLPR